jgi:putative ABC transport system ATP-binding protein
MTQDAIIQVRELTKIYQMGTVTVPALRGISLVIERGEFVAIMGPSGSGKSTLMNLLGCLDTPTSGDYDLAGQPVARLGADDLARVRARTLGFIFQQYHLLARQTALQNVELPMIYRGVPPSERRRRARQALELVNMGNRLDHQPSELSGGQQQRVAIARALVGTPAILFADEPTGALDSTTSLEIMGLLRALNEDYQLTIILVTHEADMAQYARRTLTIRDGLVASDVRHEPVDTGLAVREDTG